MAVIASLNLPQSIHGNNRFSNDWQVADAFGQAPSSFSNPAAHITPGDIGDQESSNLTKISRDNTSVKEQNPPAATSNEHNRWCFICEDRRSFDTCDGFKRHIREHYTRYYCTPQQSVVHTDDGPTCAFCSTLNPDARHLSTHNIPECRGKKYTRKLGLINHLKKNHGTEDSSELASRSEHTDGRNYFACGFCGSCFGSRNDQANHVEIVHYRNLEHISGWDPDKVIRGLLTQPGVKEHWQIALAADPRRQESMFTWNPEIVKNLQHRLEMSREPPDVLCRVAIAESNYGGSERQHVGSLPATNFTDLGMDTSHCVPRLQHPIRLSPLSPISERDSTTDSPRAVASLVQLQCPKSNWNGPYESDLDVVHEDQPSHQINSKTLKSSIGATYHHADHRAQPHASSNTTESFMQQQHPAFAPLIMSASGSPHALEGQAGILHSSKLDRQPQRVSSNFNTNPHSRQVAEAHKFPVHAQTGYFHPPTSAQSTPLPLSSNRPTSQSGQINNPLSSGHHSNFAAQLSSQETIEDMDIDPRKTQRSGHDQAHSRDQREYHWPLFRAAENLIDVSVCFINLSIFARTILWLTHSKRAGGFLRKFRMQHEYVRLALYKHLPAVLTLRQDISKFLRDI